MLVLLTVFHHFEYAGDQFQGGGIPEFGINPKETGKDSGNEEEESPDWDPISGGVEFLERLIKPMEDGQKWRKARSENRKPGLQFQGGGIPDCL